MYHVLKMAKELTETDIEKEIRTISDRLIQMHSEMPEMSGMDWASEHGWISSHEWEFAQKKSEQAIHWQEIELKKIESLRDTYPHLVDKFIARHIDRLREAQNVLQEYARSAEKKNMNFPMNFQLTLLPDIIQCFKAWQDKVKGKHWIGWAWRVSFGVLEEVEKFSEIERQK